MTEFAMLRRRPLLLIVPLAAGLATLTGALAQPQGKLRRVGMLYLSTKEAVHGSTREQAFLRGMRELGYIEGENLAVEARFADGQVERLNELSAELVRSKVEVAVATSTIACQALQRQTGTLPIVVTATADPVGDGFALSLARPGKNITGLSTAAADSVVKHLELLRLVNPRLVRVAVLVNPDSRAHPQQLERLRAAAKTLKLDIVAVPAARRQDFEAAFAAVARERADALVVLNDGLYYTERGPLAVVGLQQRLPLIYGFREGAELGMLLSYGPSLPSLFHRTASYVDKILRGANPGDLPFEQPTVFELVINLKTAKLLGLTVPKELLLRADEVIQ